MTRVATTNTELMTWMPMWHALGVRKLNFIIIDYIWVYIMFRYHNWYVNSHVVGQIRSVQGSDLTKETTRVIIRLLIDP